MKSKITKPIVFILCAALLASGIGAAIYAANTDKKATSAETKSPLLSAGEEADIVKDETVYVIAGADGTVQKIIVSDWIKNSVGSATLTDRSELKDVENVKGDESYTMNGDNMRVWDAKGNDIYCQGNIEKELPVSMSVSYKLDGKSISPAELAGKSGKVTVRFDYTNNQYETVEIDGKQEKIYVPFVMLTGMLLDTDVFTNVEVSNGKLINDGSRIAVVGVALPGMQENLNLAADKFEIPSYIEITADVKNFEMTNTVTIATNEIFNKIDLSSVDSVDSLTNSLGELKDAMRQLMDGSSKLYDGLCTLLDKSGELLSGIDRLAEGAAKLKNGTGDLNNGAADLAAGAKNLANGLAELTSNNAELNGGAKQVFESLLGMADTQLAKAGLTVPKLTVENYSKVLDGVLASLTEEKITEQVRSAALAKVTSMVNAQKDTVKAKVTEKVREEVGPQVTAAVRANVEVQVLSAMGMTKESYEAGVAAGVISAEQQAQISAAVDAQMATDAVKAIVASNLDEKMQSGEIQAIITSKTEEQISLLITENMNSEEVQAQIREGLEKAKSGADSLSALKEQLNSYNKFYTGLQAYTDGVSSAKAGADALSAGASTLKGGTAELYAGMGELYDGIFTLKNGSPALVSGVTELRDGAMQLSDGLKQFNEKGVQKLIDAVDGDLNGLFTRVKATADVSKNYKSFSGISDEMDGKVKFIYRTEAIDAK